MVQNYDKKGRRLNMDILIKVIERLETEIKNLREENKKLKKKYYDVLDERNEYMYITEQLREEIKYKEV